MKDLRKFITTCTLTFKAFDFDVTMSESKSTLWNFTTFNPNNQKSYAVFCAQALGKVKGLIKVAMKKLPKNHRLVVVVQNHSDDELEEAALLDYCLVSLGTLHEYGQEMLDIREKEASDIKGKQEKVDPLDYEDPADFIDKVIHKDKLF